MNSDERDVEKRLRAVRLNRYRCSHDDCRCGSSACAETRADETTMAEAAAEIRRLRALMETGVEGWARERGEPGAWYVNRWKDGPGNRRALLIFPEASE